MKKKLIGVMVGLAAAMPGQAFASVYGDDLTRCIMSHTSEADNTTLIKWIFAAMAASPKIKDMSNISEARRAEVNLAASQLVSRLITKDCREQTVAALKYDGAESLRNAFELFGKTAMQGLMADPSVQTSMGALDQAFDRKAFDDMLGAAGLKPKPK